MGCGKEFDTHNDSDYCYDCIWQQIARGAAPEEGDLNSALIVSGAMTAQQSADLQQDLLAVEMGTSSEGLGWDDSEWPSHREYAGEECPDCGYDEYDCICEINSLVEPHTLHIACPSYWGTEEFEGVEHGASYETALYALAHRHNDACGCSQPDVGIVDNF